MPEITVQGIELSYEPVDAITFHEGLIGLPRARQMVLVQHEILQPLYWIVSAEDPDLTYVVVDPINLFPDYRPSVTEELRARIGLAPNESPLILAIITLSHDWDKCTLNLRAPLFINKKNKKGAQAALVGSSYKLNEPLPAEILSALSERFVV